MTAVSTIARLIHHWASTQPDAIALLGVNRDPLTYGQLYRHLGQVAGALRGQGIAPGDPVAVVLPNGPDMAAAFGAIAAAACCAPLNPGYRAPEYEFYLSDLGAKALIIQAGLDSPARAVAQTHQIPVIELTPGDPMAGAFSLGVEAAAPVEDFAQPGDTALILHTSGTTSRPKMVPLTQANLCQSAHNIAATLALTPSDRCLNVMPLFHIHGLMAALLASLKAGASVVCTPGFQGDRFFDWMQTFSPTWYSAVPTMHQTVLAQASHHPDVIAQHPLRFIRSSSAALPAPILAGLEAQFNAPVIEAYGMTEAAHQMASNPLPPDPRKPGAVGLAAGPEVAIMDEAGYLLPQSSVGEVVIRGANVTAGYAQNPDANAKAFTDGWFRTGDQGYFDADHYLYLKGRLKEIINRGGEKVAPLEIDTVLMAHPEVHQAVAFAVPHPTLGEDIALAVVLKPGATLTRPAIREYLFERLADFKVPSQVAIVEAIPKGATGKLQRIGLVDKLADKLVAAAVPPRTPIEQITAAVIQAVLGLDTLSVHDNFFMIGGDSLRGTQVTNRLSVLFNLTLPNTALFRWPTVAELATFLTAEMPDPEAVAAIADVLIDLAKLPPEAITQIIYDL
jgi:acyl-CoA synthetase (AMP-forming)/AMP-acid ligase II/acyl carrier protein